MTYLFHTISFANCRESVFSKGKKKDRKQNCLLSHPFHLGMHSFIELPSFFFSLTIYKKDIQRE